MSKSTAALGFSADQPPPAALGLFDRRFADQTMAQIEAVETATAAKRVARITDRHRQLGAAAEVATFGAIVGVPGGCSGRKPTANVIAVHVVRPCGLRRDGRGPKTQTPLAMALSPAAFLLSRLLHRGDNSAILGRKSVDEI